MLRFDVTTNDWVIFAPTRAMRPDEYHQPSKPAELLLPESPTSDPKCPFCYGNERKTPHEIVAVREGSSPDSPGWQVRVIPNKFPAMCIEEDVKRQEEGKLFWSMGGCGAHEVIIDSPHHFMPLALLPVEQLHLLLKVLQERYIDLMRDIRFQAIVIFKNHGVAAGTSLAHPHCQLIATPVAPRMIRQRIAIATEHFDRTGSCLYSELMDAELDARMRVISENEHHVAFCPYASHVPFETWIVPRLRQSSFRWVDPVHLRSLAQITKRVLLMLHLALGNPDFNLTIDSAPRGDEDSECFHWHIQIRPRLTTPAGFELGSGMSINTTLPETAASFLREVPIPANP